MQLVRLVYNNVDWHLTPFRMPFLIHRRNHLTEARVAGGIFISYRRDDSLAEARQIRFATYGYYLGPLRGRIATNECSHARRCG